MSLEKLRIAVVRGGNTSQYESSLRTGETILKALRECEHYTPVDVFVDRAGAWHVRGLPAEPSNALKHVDLVWNVSNGQHKDGKLEQMLEATHIPYIGSGAVSGALAGNIRYTRDVYARAKLPTIRYELLPEYSDDALLHIFRNFLHPVTIRAQDRSSKFGSKLVHTYKELEESVRGAFEQGTQVVVEEFMKGREALTAVLENARGEKLYAFLPAELRGEKSVAPGNFTSEEKRAMEDLARKAHHALGLRHYSASRFLVTPRGTVYILETIAMPDLSPDSAVSKSLKATGWKERDLVDHLISQIKN